MHSSNGAHPRIVFLVAEEVGDAPDEGYVKVVLELTRALGKKATVIRHMTPERPRAAPDSAPSSRMRTGLRRMRALLNKRLRAALAETRPETVVYVSRSSISLTALMRSRLLKWMGRQARVVMIALQPRSQSWYSRLASRMLWPDLVLVSTNEEVRGVEALGARAARMMTGVDIERFRPPNPGEKEALRKKWGIPTDTRVVLHVGHLTGGRNLEALLPLASQAGITVVVVASSHRDRESQRLEQTLRDAGVVLIHGYLAQVDEVYRLADCYIFPTISTDYAIAMPLSVLEAMASDLPVAATRFGALPERFGAVDGVVLVHSSDQLSGAVADLMARRPSTRKASETYSWAAVADQVAAT
jgi:glycosyltransferase involved in cell wall biosynthesis